MTGGGYHALIEYWNGVNWVAVSPSPSDGGLQGIAAVASSDAWAVGTANGAPLALHWDGASWTAVAVPAPSGSNFSVLAGVAATGPKDVWAAGSWEDTITGKRHPLVEHWDGNAWSITRLASPSTSDTFLNGIAIAPKTQWAVGGVNSGFDDLVMRSFPCVGVVSDTGIDPNSAQVKQGTNVYWSFDPANSQNHSVSDATGMGLYDSGNEGPGAFFTFKFKAAGTYPYVDINSGHTASISVPLAARPHSAPSGSNFTITWSANAAAAPYVYDVQVKQPGSANYVDWKTGVTSRQAIFGASDPVFVGAGTYRFRARIRNVSAPNICPGATGACSGYSTAKSIIEQ